jgi:hypothetical protein
MVEGVTRFLAAGVILWAAAMLVAVPGWAQSDGDGDGDAGVPAAPAPGGGAARAPAATAGQEDEAAPPAPEHEDATATSPGDPYAVEPYDRDRSEEDAGLPTELPGEPSARAGDSEDPASADPYATDPYGESAE